jgi:hypothetical protein
VPAPVPIRWLGNGHLQTIYNVLGDFSLIDNITYSRTLLRTPDGGTLGLDFVHNPDSLDHRVRGEDAETRAESEDTTPILVIAHGLTGGSYESYVRCANARPFIPGSRRPLLTVGLPPSRNVLHYVTLSKAKGGLGMRGCVVNVGPSRPRGALSRWPLTRFSASDSRSSVAAPTPP